MTIKITIELKSPIKKHLLAVSSSFDEGAHLITSNITPRVNKQMCVQEVV